MDVLAKLLVAYYLKPQCCEHSFAQPCLLIPSTKYRALHKPRPFPSAAIRALFSSSMACRKIRNSCTIPLQNPMCSTWCRRAPRASPVPMLWSSMMMKATRPSGEAAGELSVLSNERKCGVKPYIGHCPERRSTLRCEWHAASTPDASAGHATICEGVQETLDTAPALTAALNRVRRTSIRPPELSRCADEPKKSTKKAVGLAAITTVGAAGRHVSFFS